MNDNYDLNSLRKKPKRKNSRTKGNTFERQVAKLLNDRFKTTEFSRSPGSGAFASTHTLPDHLYSLYNYSSEIWKFIAQSEKDAGKCGLTPMVIFKQDRQPALAIIPERVQVTEDIKYIQIHNKKQYRVYLFEELLTCWDSMWFDL